ncbi:MAG TPA: ferritin family protein [Vicinamibacterales bacterium]|nr:ferritin family protein [Vicinamibacterales bacterium]
MSLLARLLGAMPHDKRHLLDDLLDAYRAEAEHAAHLRQHAERARYPQAAAQLQALAAQEDRHAAMLRELIQQLGGGVPPIAPAPLPGRNPWARAVAAQEAAQRKRREMLQRVNRWDPEAPEAAALMRRIEQEDRDAAGLYSDLIMRADPQSLDD